MIQGKKLLALNAIGTGYSIEKASEVANVSRTTIYRWLQDEAFQAEYTRIQGELIRRISLRLLNITEQALQALEEGLNSRDVKLRIKVAEIALSRAPSLAELGALNERLTRLENKRKV